MSCIDRQELEQFLKGRLDPKRLLAVDEHVQSCAKCKAALTGMPAQMNVRAELGASLLGVEDCPEYEELSALVDGSLADDLANRLKAHANRCELCARDIARISELRSHAAMRQKVVVGPGMARQPKPSPFWNWKRALAGAMVAGAVTAVAVFGNFVGTATNTPTVVAKNPSVVENSQKSAPAVEKPQKQILPSTPINRVAQKPAAKPVVPPSIRPAPKPQPVKPTYVAVLKDGAYSVVRKGRDLVIAKGGSPVRTELEARIAAGIEEKLRTGKIQQAKPVQMAMASLNMRTDDSGYEISQSAPKQAAPVAKVLMDNTPSFTWSAVDLADSYKITVYDESNNPVIDEITDKTSFTPAKPLARGQEYKWRVAVRFSEAEDWKASSAVKFKILSEEDYASIQQIKNQLPGSHLALGVTYESFGLYDAAVNEYRELRRENPKSKLAQKMLTGAAQLDK